MNISLRKSTFTVTLLGLLALSFAGSARAGSVNKSVRIDAGATAGGASSVNGSVTVGEAAVVNGEVSTVNGTIRIDDDARVEDVSTVNGAVRIGSGVSSQNVSTVNGSIRVDERVSIAGYIEAVNGSIEVEKGSTIDRDVSNVNGKIELVGSQIGGDLSTVNGDVILDDGSVLRGDLVVSKPGGWTQGWKKRKPPRVIIGPGSQVLGKIKLEREVRLYISDSAEVGGVEGEMAMSDAVRFDGKRP